MGIPPISYIAAQETRMEGMPYMILWLHGMQVGFNNSHCILSQEFASTTDLQYTAEERGAKAKWLGVD